LSLGDEQRPVYSHPVLQRVTRQPALPRRDPRTSLALTITRSQGLQTSSTGVAGTIPGLVNRSLQLPIGPHKVQGHIPVIRPGLHHPQSTEVRTQSTGRLISHLLTTFDKSHSLVIRPCKCPPKMDRVHPGLSSSYTHPYNGCISTPPGSALEPRAPPR
jgi:hypothetical protein